MGGGSTIQSVEELTSRLGTVPGSSLQLSIPPVPAAVPKIMKLSAGTELDKLLDATGKGDLLDWMFQQERMSIYVSRSTSLSSLQVFISYLDHSQRSRQPLFEDHTPVRTFRQENSRFVFPTNRC